MLLLLSSDVVPAQSLAALSSINFVYLVLQKVATDFINEVATL